MRRLPLQGCDKSQARNWSHEQDHVKVHEVHPCSQEDIDPADMLKSVRVLMHPDIERLGLTLAPQGRKVDGMCC